MNYGTVNDTVKNGLCCGCGICKGICPRECISWDSQKGMYVPSIDGRLCVECGMCASVCPGLGHAYEPRKTALDTVSGSVQACFNAWSRDPELRHVSASGGVVSAIIRELLVLGKYDGAFCLDSYDYREQLKTRIYTAGEVAALWSQSNAPKSRYLPVSHENAVAYMKQNRNARLIFVGASCAVRGLQAAIQTLKLNREQYLFIGLFCDRVFTYNVLSYFSDTYASGRELEALHFKNKESGGWPGDMKLFPKTGEPFYVPLSERAKAKAYFMPERCLYCADKLNVCADISLGDNYTGRDDSELGSNSVMIRTSRGMDAWETVHSCLEVRTVELAAIQKAQYLEDRLNHVYFAALKTAGLDKAADLNRGVPQTRDCALFERAWRTNLKKLQAGQVYDRHPCALKKQICLDSGKPNPIVSLCIRGYYFLKRKLS